MNGIPIGHHAVIDEDELTFEFTRSSGPGGQNVNKVSTRVTLRFDVGASPSLDPAQKARIRKRLATRISRQGILRVVVSKHRAQSANRRAAVERFVDLMTQALRVRKPRKKTTVPAAVQRRRREEKTRCSQRRRERSWRYDE